MTELREILETALYVNDLDKAEVFYSGVLGLSRIGRQAGRHVFFRCGEAVLLIFNPETTNLQPSEVGGMQVPLHGTRGAGHMAFRVTASDFSDWRKRLAEYGVAIEVEISWPGGGQSIYFRDPAGNSLELATPQVWGLQ